MSFDRATRTTLARMVSACRTVLTADIEDQLRRTYGLQSDGLLLEVEKLGLDDRDREIADQLRRWQEHLAAAEPATGDMGNGSADRGKTADPKRRRAAAFRRMAHETAFTLLNRLVALRMAEERDLARECVRRGFESDGFALFERLTGGTLGSRPEAYRIFLERMFDELAAELGVLFDRRTPHSLVFPSDRCLQDVLKLLQAPELVQLWGEDETIGWVYQYFNPKEERDQMRKASPSPRSSRELAVRNQFFTPRYVVEFLTDNTLGRLWYEIRRGDTRLAQECRYLVHRRRTIFLNPGETVPSPFRPVDGQSLISETTDEAMWARPDPELEDLREIGRYAMTIDGDRWAQMRGCERPIDLWQQLRQRHDETGGWESSFEELRLAIFAFQQKFGAEDEQREVLSLYRELCRRWDLETEIIAHRPKKDPRELKILDPACGSGHFLLYAYDLLETIYVEAWEEASAEAELRRQRGDAGNTTGPLREANSFEQSPFSSEQSLSPLYLYRDERSLRRDIPALILEHNLHGIEIDRRACQVAALGLWLRAQRSYSALGLKRSERPRIHRANVVVAEALPWQFDVLRTAFVKTMPEKLQLLDVLERVIDEFRLAGEVGSLLRTDDCVPADLEQDFHTVLRGMKQDPSLSQGRIFIRDLGRGVDFLSRMRKRYDVVLMNPPFGAETTGSRNYLKTHYPDSCQDIFGPFVERAFTRFAPEGKVGVLSTEAGFYRRNLEAWRDTVVRDTSLEVMLHLGDMVLDEAKVRVAAYVLDPRKPVVQSTCIRVMRPGGRGELAAECVAAIRHGWPDPRVYHMNQSEFQKLPYGVFGYWCSPELRNIFSACPTLEGNAATVRQGLATADDFRFLRLRWELPFLESGWGHGWLPFAKGGGYSPFHDDVHLLVNWHDSGAELITWGKGRPQNTDFYGRPGLTYPPRTNKRFAPRALPEGCAFGHKGPAIVDVKGCPAALVAVLNSRTVAYLLSIGTGITPDSSTQLTVNSYEVGLVQRLPVPEGITEDQDLADLGHRSWEVRSGPDLRDETTAWFASPFHPVPVGSLRETAARILTRRRELETDYDRMQSVIDERVRNWYRLTDRDWQDVEEQIGPAYRVEVPADDDPFWLRDLSFRLVQYAIGCVFGRWDIRRILNPEPVEWGPFDRHPEAPPGALNLASRGDGPRPFPSDYPLQVSADGILVDDPGLEGLQPHPQDIVQRVREVFAVLYGDGAEAVEQEACELLGARNLCDYLRKPSGFFADHLACYSKSRRQAPIYWPLSTDSGSYTVWLYYHRLDDDALYRVVNRYVLPKITEIDKHAIRVQAELAEAEGRAATRLRTHLEEARALLEELQAFRAEILRVAQLPYRPNLNDGVTVTASPLWRLFGHTKWRKGLEECWSKLVGEDYEWAHLAQTIWGDRVLAKCRTDRSLAIAHGVEDLYGTRPEELPAKHQLSPIGAARKRAR